MKPTYRDKKFPDNFSEGSGPPLIQQIEAQSCAQKAQNSANPDARPRKSQLRRNNSLGMVLACRLPRGHPDRRAIQAFPGRNMRAAIVPTFVTKASKFSSNAQGTQNLAS